MLTRRPYPTDLSDEWASSPGSGAMTSALPPSQIQRLW
jgi:hypothetical protein